ncbi:MAG TPA: hypothetical protein DCR48_05575 [Flavobacteriales bacterium]|mgnify:FL=1|nr:hypothetical protein [Flavobacteriales bacterium]
MKFKYSFLILGLLFGFDLCAQKVLPNRQSALNSDQKGVELASDYVLDWRGVREYRTIDERMISQIVFDGARVKSDSYLPYFAITIELDNATESVKVSLDGVKSTLVNSIETALLSKHDLPSDFKVSSIIRNSSGKKYLVIMVEPLRRSSSQVEKLLGFNIRLTKQNQVNSFSRGGRGSNSWVDNSVLNAGQWFKLATGKDGIYRVSLADMQEYGFGISGLNSDQIKMFGAKAGMLSMRNSDERPDDLVQIPIDVIDGGDGTFDQGDFFLFYGQDRITWTSKDGEFAHDLNPFSDSVFYFLTINGSAEPAKRIQEEILTAAATSTSASYDFLDLYEEENMNLIKSGRRWYGQEFGSVNSRDYGFNVPNIDRSSSVNLKARYAARSIGISGVSVSLSLPSQGSVSDVNSISPVADFYGALYADNGLLELSTMPSDGDLLTKFELIQGPNLQSKAWLDYIELHARRSINFLPPFMSFRDIKSVGVNAITQFNVKASEAIRVWDVTNINEAKEADLTGGVVNGFSFKSSTSILREFVVFNESSYLSPRKIGFIENQNLHSLSNIEYVIVSHPTFKVNAERLADLHSSIDGLTSVVVTPAQIYNEFSGGAQDITAIKEFMRMLYHEADSSGGIKPRYLLLFGDASYDYKDKISGNSNFVPTHQMLNSLSPTGSIASDDYYGLLDDDEGESQYDFLDIGIGRLPARNSKEAEDMVNKIERYAQNSSSFGEWRNKIAFVADDADRGDGLTFMRDFETLGTVLDQNAKEFLIDKIYMDSFKQQLGSGGARYPDGADAVSDRIGKGALMMYYIGHGGELGWAHERILEVPTINKWTNISNLPLFITATCEFGRFDDPRRTSGGEYVLLNPSGGGIALLTTTRAVYSSPNLTLTTEFTAQAFENLGSEKPRLGDLMLQTKIRTLDTNSSAALNSRSFALLGDPALRLAYPENRIEITSMPDTIGALGKVKVSGIITDYLGNQLNDFNGILYPSVFDKAANTQSLNNDNSGPFSYQEWRNLVFKGKTSVKNGAFSFEFVVPKDINRTFDIGRVNLYADNSKLDANGDFRLFNIGGLSDNPIDDSEGPAVDLYLNNSKFIFGGLTNESPNLYAEVEDENGINMVGSGIGHDITAVLDNNTSNTLVLNDYYESDLDSYTSGKVSYPFNDLTEGKHSLKLQVWDVNNNPSDSYTEFIVANDEELALDHVLNYPNPFTTNTDFYFEHNKPGQSLRVRIEVFTIAGKLVKTMDGDFVSDGFRIGPINWNGRDEFGDVIARGVYLYRVSVKTILGESVEKYERLVLLK